MQTKVTIKCETGTKIPDYRHQADHKTKRVVRVIAMRTTLCV
ncbi:hypothetical protein HMPREF0658_0638 [Hoylesella marshii DSM 16973 = JCM 13450]|uniref:Uncharacterized protein n=1 Tax=Hoylesella marshii DSM 16973 = JCM 13450 TaxID=862515 RepID=E0NR37_9BACT|nr:hypothetical protein HMPREF0658_0638 [Hoylesella marshii DSM 16973 = JCM 13450]